MKNCLLPILHSQSPAVTTFNPFTCSLDVSSIFLNGVFILLLLDFSVLEIIF